MRTDVLAVCGDAGGAAAVAPVLDRLARDGRATVAARAYRQAREVWSRAAWPFGELEESTTEAELGSLAAAAGVLLVGTSVNGVDFERRLAAAAPERTVAVLDFWSNYAQRFRGPSGRLVQPAVTCVMDREARDAMVAAGFAPDRLEVTGQPAFDDLARLRASFGADRVAATRAEWGVPSNGWLVTFASQPLAEVYARPELKGHHPGYDQHGALRLLLDRLEHTAAAASREAVLLVRPHPRETAGSLDWAAAHRGRVRVRVSGDGESRACALASDLVCGMTSVLLVEACYLGCLVLSLQPGLAGPDALPTNRAGWSRLVRAEAELDGALRAWLLDPAAAAEQRARLGSAALDGRAAERVAAVVYRLLDQRKER